MKNKKIVSWLKVAGAALFVGIFAFTGIPGNSMDASKVQAASSGTIYYGFTEITNIGGMNTNSTYMFLTEHYSNEDAVVAIPSGSARLTLTAVPALGGNSSGAVTTDGGVTATQGNVHVEQSGAGFDGCTDGHIGYLTRSGKTGWYYGCSVGGATNVGPFYVYSYSTATFSDSDITVEVTDAFDVPTSRRSYTDSNDLTGLLVKIRVNGQEFNVPYFTVASRDNSVDPATGDTSVILNIGGVEKQAELKCRQASPAGETDYTTGELKGLTPNGTYIIKVDGKEIEVIADQEGKIDLTPYAGKTIEITKPGNGSNLLDSDAQIIGVKSSAIAPKKDNYKVTGNGAYTIVSGITKDQEYSLDGGKTWISGTGEDIKVKTGEVVQVRVKATEEEPASEIVKVETVGENTNLTIGNIKDSNGNPCAGVEVELRNGSTVIATTTTAEDGSFAFVGVPEGTYNLVVKQDGKTETYVVKIVNGKVILEEITVADGNLNSTINIKEGTPTIVVGNIQSQFDTIVQDTDKGYTKEDEAIVKAGGSAEINVNVSVVKSDVNNAKYIAQVASKDGMTVGNFIDIIITKIVTDVEGRQTKTGLIELPKVLTFYIDIESSIQGKADYVVYRYHQGYIDTITTTPNADGEYIEISEDGTKLILHVKKFSTYAIGYSDEAKAVNNKSVSIQSLVEKVSTPVVKAAPKTGDNTPVVPFAVASVAALAILVMSRRKRVVVQ